MAKLVVLKLEGSVDRGCRVTMEIAPEGDRPRESVSGDLPPMTQLRDRYNDWRSTYHQLGLSHRGIRALQVRYNEGSRTEEIEQGLRQCRELADRLHEHLNNWLKSPSFLKIRETWLENIDRDEEVRVLIATLDPQLRQIPWHQWEFLDNYRRTEVGLCAPEYRSPSSQKLRLQPKPVRILAIFGYNDGLDLDSDRAFLKKLPGAQLTCLKQPQRHELNDKLWSRPWDILFFAGHSITEGDTGRIYINETDSLTVEELQRALKKAVDRGLQLAIFNSCDGLGLASALEQLHLPQVIVMREPVPDEVAREFLRHFLRGFARGNSLYQAVREARDRLHGKEDNFPCASWLPAICQNPAARPPTWSQLRGIGGQGATKAVAASVLAALAVIALRHFGMLQLWELQAYDTLMRLRSPEPMDDRLLVVEATAADVEEYGFPLPDDVLARTLETLDRHQARAVGLNIFRDRPVGEGRDRFLDRLQARDGRATICTVHNSDSTQAIPPPEGAPENTLGFSNVVLDPDGILRRHLLFMNTDRQEPCATEMALSTRLALNYLAVDGIEAQTVNTMQMRLGETTFVPLEGDRGPYANLDARGFQVMLNYRQTDELARRVSLSQLLDGNVDADWIHDRAVLVGVTAPLDTNSYFTPQSAATWPYEQTSGLWLQAQMTSQLLGAALDGRSPIWMLPPWGETLWIWGWAAVGAGLVWRWGRTPKTLAAVAIAVVSVGGVSVWLLEGGAWMPVVPGSLAVAAAAGGTAIASSTQQRINEQRTTNEV